ncbi:hypothetical protein AMTRI_Chr03g53650 [Amborella trichopoda]
MRREVTPDETTLATVAFACSKPAMVDMYCKCGSLEKARELFDAMNHKNSFSWKTMISGYRRNGNLHSACELFDKMPGRTAVS